MTAIAFNRRGTITVVALFTLNGFPCGRLEMEFDGNLSKLQGTLYSLGTQGLLNKPDTLNIVVEALKEITKNLQEDAKSKAAFFMVLNTQLAVSEELKDDEFVGLITGITPSIDKEYLIIYAYHSQLHSQLFKVIENSPGGLTLELLDIIIEKLNDPGFHKDEFGTEHLYQLWECVFVKMFKISKGIHVGDDLEKFRCYFIDIYDLIQKVLIMSMKMNGLEKYVGSHLYCFFKTVLRCVALYNNPNLSDDAVYQLSIQFKCKEKEELNVTESIMKTYINLIFEKIYKILENLTLDMWLTFSECYFDFDSKNSIQLLIGDLVHSILNEVKDFELPSNVLNCLLNFSISKLDLMAKADMEEIISNVKSGKKEWFSIFLNHVSFTERGHIEGLLDHLNLASLEDLNVILNSTYDYLYNCEENENLDLIKDLFLAAVKMTDNYSPWFDKVFVKYRPCLLTTAHTHDEIIETFNKISKENIPQQDLISLCMQSPFETIKKICCISLYDSRQTEFIVETLELFKTACNVSPFDGSTLLDCVLVKILEEELTDKEKQSFVNLVVHLQKKNLLKCSFLKNIFKSLKEYLENEMLEKAVLCLEVIKVLLDSTVFCFDISAFLVFMSQVLGNFSWDLKCFSTIKVVGRDLTGQIIVHTIQRLEEVDIASFHWARQEILKSWEISQVYFCDLWFSCGYVWRGSGTFHSCLLALAHSHSKTEDLRKFLISFGQAFEVRASIVLSLTVLLPVLTYREWDSIFNQLLTVWRSMNSGKSDVDVYHDVLDIFGSSLLVLTLHLKENDGMYLCYQYCLRNFGRLEKNHCAKMSGRSFLSTLEKSFLILRTIENEEKRKSCWEILSPVTIELIDLMKKKNIIEANKGSIKELLPMLNLKGVAEVIINKLQ